MLGPFWRSKLNQNPSHFLIDFAIDFLLIWGPFGELFGIIVRLFIDVFRDDVKTGKMAWRVGESTNMEGCEGQKS